MKLETKFNLGQRVYYVDKSAKRAFCSCCTYEYPSLEYEYKIESYAIDGIHISKEKRKVIVEYSLTTYWQHLEEKDLFETRKQAEKRIQDLKV